MSPPQNKYGPAKAIEFYNKNTVIFLTGATGFIGKAILEKLLRSFPQITKIYLLIRVSGKKTLKDRIENIFSSRIFDTVKSQFSSAQEFQEKIVRKVVPVKGDISANHLGLSDEDMAMAQEDTTVFINSAASIKFNDPLKTALEINTNGPLRIFEIAKGCKNLAAIVHISTCFVNAPMFEQHIDEIIYPHPLGDDPEAIYDMLSTKMSSKEIKDYEESVVLKAYPNTYTFAKSLAEHLIKSRYRDMALPIVIVRPAIVTAAYKEPVPGWVEGSAATNKAIVAGSIGLIQEWIGNESAKADLVPVDFVVKTTLLSATTADRTLTEPRIYHVGTSCINPITWSRFGMYMVAYWRAVAPPSQRVSDDIRFELYPPAEFKYRYNTRFGGEIRTLARHKHDEERKVYISRAMVVPTVLIAFLQSEWFFDVTNTLVLDDAAPAELKSELKSGIDWDRYMEDYNAGVQGFILCEKVDRPIVTDYTAELRPVSDTKREGSAEVTFMDIMAKL